MADSILILVVESYLVEHARLEWTFMAQLRAMFHCATTLTTQALLKDCILFHPKTSTLVIFWGMTAIPLAFANFLSTAHVTGCPNYN